MHSAIRLSSYIISSTCVAFLLTSPLLAEVPLSQKLPAQAKVVYEYQTEGRPDPFTPFMKSRVPKKILDPNEIIEDTDMILTGMQRFEPGQLELVATLRSRDTGPLAMVQDSTGEGYVLREGMLIGRKGKVDQIGSDSISIIETSTTRSGKKIRSTVIMQLNKEENQ